MVFIFEENRRIIICVDVEWPVQKQFWTLLS
jgi:hypothetical protein